jgi:HAD superfamily hydrolase (TIGR01484 family)
MRFQALACDYDGTLASDGLVSPPTLAALRCWLASKRQLILVTGRELPDLLAAFPSADLFEWLVAENGALLYRPATGEQKLLGEAPPEGFVQTLQQRGVQPLSISRVIVSTAKPYETVILEVIRDLGLDLQIIFNKGSVMVLPAGMNKGTGLSAALKEMNLSPESVAGIGDAENDPAFLKICGCSAAVANALPAVKEQVDVVTAGEEGAGVVELIDELLKNDFRDWKKQSTSSRPDDKS